MLGRIILAGGVALVMAALMPGLNDFLKDVTENTLSSLPGITNFELTYWKMIPILMMVYFVFVLPIFIIFRRKKEEDDKTKWNFPRR